MDVIQILHSIYHGIVRIKGVSNMDILDRFFSKTRLEKQPNE